jgi:hypothetical protein
MNMVVDLVKRLDNRRTEKPLRVAMFGYQETFLSLAEAKALVDKATGEGMYTEAGAESASSLMLNLTSWKPNYGLNAVPVSEAGALLTPEGRKRHGIDENIDPARILQSNQQGELLWSFETFALFRNFGCHCEAFDLIPISAWKPW